jgi:predicted enzyme related to lactoylglutathione lyase
VPTSYILVELVEEYSKKVVDLGGKIVVQKIEIPGLGWWALALDPKSNTFGLFEYMQK